MATIYVKTTGNDTTGDGSEGNPYATPGKAAGVAVTSGDKIYVKSGTYTLTSGTSNIAGGRVTLSPGVHMEGYQTTAGDLGTPPVIDAGVITGISIVTMTGTYTGSTGASGLLNIITDGNGGAANVGVTDNTTHARLLCLVIARDCPGTGFVLAGANREYAALLRAENCGDGFSGNGIASLYGCLAIGCTDDGFVSTSNSNTYVFCIATDCGGQGFDNAWGTVCYGCIAHGNGSDGFRIVTYEIGSFIACIAVSNGGYGFSLGVSGPCLFVNNAMYNNTAGAINNAPTRAIGSITLTADPFVDAAGGDFNINNVAGGGADLRAATIVLP